MALNKFDYKGRNFIFDENLINGNYVAIAFENKKEILRGSISWEILADVNHPLVKSIYSATDLKEMLKTSIKNNIESLIDHDKI
ncbi:hypothetical protein LPTSP2_38510 [Leptospira ellinghausenii]|uniref:Uncharacterized protein n=1 Tax=Leptospira ellinghausenii TaxID=1917822 RepID=A0A2P2DIT9_9LEPT|nr:hypothetical protein [Leptospira ellinghausenii]GBF44548.1 hypothetical protein LPTSP2_38510 [Leptospira ellinghausenii]